MILFFDFLQSNVPDNKCHKQKWHVLFLTHIKLVAGLLTCTRVIAHIKWIRLALNFQTSCCILKITGLGSKLCAILLLFLF